MSTRSHTRAPRRDSRARRTVPAPRSPVDSPWELRPVAGGAVVSASGRPFAHGRVEDTGDRVVVEFWTSPGVPQDLRVRLARLTFRDTALRARRPVLVCLPAGDSVLLTEVRTHLAGACSRVAGATCLVEGRVGEGPAGDQLGPPAADQFGSTTRTSVTGRRPLVTPGSATVG